jgi:ABC-2 type transport system permease protein
MNRLAGIVGVVVLSARHQMLIFLSAWRIGIVLGVVQPAVLLLITLSAPAHVTTGYATRVALGVMTISFWSFTVWSSAGILQQDRADGTLSACMVGVRDMRLVLVGKTLGTSLVSGLLILTTIIAILLAFGQAVSFAQPGWLVLGLVILLLSGLTLGVGISAVFVLTRFGPQISSALMYPIFLLGGLLTPLSALPAGVRWLSWLVSLRWSIDFMTSAADGPPNFFALAMTLVLTAAYGIGAAFTFDRFTAAVRAEGTIDLV